MLSSRHAVAMATRRSRMYIPASKRFIGNDTIKSIDEKIKRIQEAQAMFATYDQKTVDHIFRQVAHAANKQRVPLAKLAVEETRMGLMEDKVIKNGVVIETSVSAYGDMKTCGIIDRDIERGLIKIATPVGPLACITPCTNPTSTVIIKSLFALKTRNAAIFLPHPRASACSHEAMRVCRDAAVAAGAPPNVLDCVEHPTLELNRHVMDHSGIKLIVATGGPGMVKASYSTGKPALGVGAGNASVLVDDTADLKMAASSIVMGKTFDNGVICASEQSTVVIESIFEEFKALLQKRGVHFVYGEERKKLGEFLIKGGSINPDIVGQSAQTIAQKCGIKIPGDAVVIATEASEVGPHEPFSFEKLSPVMTLYRAASFNEAKDLCASIVHFGGEGHTAVIHSNDENRIAAFAAAMPAHHLFANVPSSIAAVGTAFNFNVPPSLTLGVGTTGGSSIATNLTPASLINVKLMASRQEHMEWMKTPPNLYFNRNCTREAIADLAKPYPGGKRDTRAMIITDRAMVEFGYCTKVQMMLEQIGFKVAVFDEVAPDPTIECVRAGAAACEQFKPEVLIGLGGGSPMDAAKGIRVFYEHPEAKLEDVGARFIELRKRTCPFPDTGSKVHKLVCIPTTSGTGSEVTPFAVITEGTHKYPLFSYRMTPDVAIVDSAFCDNLPKSLVANAGVDALVHAIEAYVSVASNDFTKAHATRAVKLLFEYLPESYKNGTIRAREMVHHASTIAGIAFANSFLGITHSLSHQIGGAFHTPHGMTNAILMEHVIDYNAVDAPTRMGVYPQYTHPLAKQRYAELARAIGCNGNSDYELVQKFKQRISELKKSLDIPATFAEAGINKDAYYKIIDSLAEHAFDDQCTPANPRFPLVTELRHILESAYDGQPLSSRMYLEPKDAEANKAKA